MEQGHGEVEIIFFLNHNVSLNVPHALYNNVYTCNRPRLQQCSGHNG